MGYGIKPKKTYDGRLIVTGGDPFTTSFLIINKVNFPNTIFTPLLDGFISWDEDSGEIEFLKSGLLHIGATNNYDVSTGSSRIEISTELFTTSWVYLNSRSGSFPSTGENQLHLSGQLEVTAGCKIRFSARAASGTIASKTTTLINLSVIPAAIIDFTLWEQ